MSLNIEVKIKTHTHTDDFIRPAEVVTYLGRAPNVTRMLLPRKGHLEIQ